MQYMSLYILINYDLVNENLKGKCVSFFLIETNNPFNHLRFTHHRIGSYKKGQPQINLVCLVLSLLH